MQSWWDVRRLKLAQGSEWHDFLTPSSPPAFIQGSATAIRWAPARIHPPVPTQPCDFAAGARNKQEDPSCCEQGLLSSLSLRDDAGAHPSHRSHSTARTLWPAARTAAMGDMADELDLNTPPFPLTAIDREILATRDEDYHRTTWSDLKHIIGMHLPSR